MKVKEVYEIIADEFDETRQYVWNGVRLFLDNCKSGESVLEVGCGNGKNMLYRDDLNLSGIDVCENFVKMCNNRYLDVKLGDILNIEYEDNKFDKVISIAVIHHLESKEKRLKGILEMLRVVKENGLILITVWAKNQPKKSRRKFKSNDELVSWKSRRTKKIYYRYYHVYDDEELREDINILNSLENLYKIEILDYYSEVGNWCIILKKIKK